MRFHRSSVLGLSVVSLLAACASPPAQSPESVLAVPVPATATATAPETVDGRLPSTVRPLGYDLELTVDPAQKAFSGKASIRIALTEASAFIVLHGVDIHVQRASLRLAGGAVIGGQVSHRRATGSTEDDELVVALEGQAPVGEHTLDIAYDAPFGTSLAGLYTVEEGGKPYAFTQFEAIDARRAFPCFDEPGFKVPMSLAVRVPKGQLAVANTPEIARVDEGAQTLFRFAATPPTSSYLLALAVGDFDVREIKGARVPVRLIATKGQARLGTRALEETVRVLAELERWFASPYPYAKLDIVAVPNFRAGAMENPGLVTFRDSLLLLDEGATVASRFAQTTVIAHELAHQWFGDLVTMGWWNDIWLNEGFANWLETQITDLVRPEFEDYAHSAVEVRGVMEEDTLASTRVVRQPVKTAADAEDAFDGITYVKGGAFLDMLQGYLGAEKFRDGIRRYINKFAWKNATSEDFLATLDDGSGTVQRIAKSFLEKPGVPVLSFEKSCGKTPKVVVRQKADRPIGGDDRPGLWTMPLCAGDGAARACTILDAAETTLEGPIAQAICKGSVDGGATLYAHLDPTADDAKTPRLAKLTGRERAAKLLDTWALVRRDPSKLPLLVAMLEAADPFVDRATTAARLSILDDLEERIAKPGDAAFEAFAEARLKRSIAALDRPNAKEGATLLTKSAWMVAERTTGGHVHMSDEASLAKSYLSGTAGALADKGAAAVELSMRGAKGADIEARLAEVKAGISPDRRPAAVRSLFAASSNDVFDGSLGIVTSEFFRLQDARFLLGAAGANGKQRMRFVSWVDGHFEELTKKFSERLGVYFVGPIGWVCDAPTLSKLEASFAPRIEALPDAKRAYAQAREGAHRCIALREAAAPYAKFGAKK
jgi:alanyl aminopeptidase